MVLLAAIDRNRAIGKNNALLYRIPEDMRHFRALTVGNIVIYGRKTLESFPDAKPLPNRDNIVLSKYYENTSGYPNLSVVRSVEEVLSLPRTGKEVYVIGGESVYRTFCDLCDTAILTEVDATTEDADAFFPILSEQSGWHLVEASSEQISVSGLRFRFVKYKKVLS